MNFMEALDTKVEDIKRPPMLPLGHYRVAVNKIPTISASEDKKYDFVDFSLKFIEATDQVDQDELREFGGLGTSTIRNHRFLFNTEEKSAFDRTLYQIKRFLMDHLKVDVPPSAPLKEMLNAAVGAQCMVQIGRRTDKNDKEIIYEDIKGTAPLA